MGAMEREPVATGTLRCGRCGDVIGVYEPLVHVIDNIAHKTSRAADPQLAAGDPRACYHLACSDLADGDFVSVP
jgi:hypothetical protein